MLDLPLLLLLACTDKAGPSVEDTGAPCAPSAWYADQDGDGFGAGEGRGLSRRGGAVRGC